MPANPFRRRAILSAIAAAMLASDWMLISMSYSASSAPWPHISESRRADLWILARGMCVMQPYLLAAWAALGPEHFATRVGRSTLMLVVLWTAPVWWRPGPWNGVPAAYWVGLAALGAQFLFSAALFTALRVRWGWRIIPLETWHKPPGERAQVFSLSEFFIQILGFAMVLTYMRAFTAFGLYLPTVAEILKGARFALLAAVVSGPMTAFCVALALASTGRLRYASVVVILAVTFGWRGLMNSISGQWSVPAPETIFLAGMLLVLALVRLAGYRLWRTCDLQAAAPEPAPASNPAAVDA